MILDRDEILVDLCQSSSGEAKGPQTNSNVTLVKSPGDTFEGAQKFKILRAGIACDACPTCGLYL